MRQHQAEGYEDSDSVTQTFTLWNQAGDIDGDGELTIGDITRLINQYLQIDGRF